MNNRAGEFVTNLSGEMAYKSFKPSPLPPVPPIDRRPFLKSLLERAEKFALPARQSGLFHKTTH